ncbi:hypothetical protein SAMN05428959_10417 [Duganella sp. CF517]|uniref:hypothetical protein n=1 Tax=Duganella sp. CF517 TaxID=1881038 RepID=UPI0008B8C7E9|nr:hypothetical protein [Duganella sp. CF517]SEN98431.1 hypothetical protein SAMN05428959_10417 [Duganella sp. CF517]
MERLCLLLLSGLLAANLHAKTPSKMITLSCLAAKAMSPSVKLQPIATDKIYSEEDYKDGFNATYYVISHGKQIGYAERGEENAIIYGDYLLPIARARMLPGFNVRPTELNPFSADWAKVGDKNGSYLCVSFPFGDLGQSGGFQNYRSAYLIAVNGNTGRPILFAATASQ